MSNETILHGQSELGGNLPVGGFPRVPDAPVLTMAQLASDVLALLDYFRLPKAVFAGCSIGGYVMLELWRRALRGSSHASDGTSAMHPAESHHGHFHGPVGRGLYRSHETSRASLAPDIALLAVFR